LLAELLVRWILHAKLGLDINCIEFGISAFGKPFIKGLENINFNLSHSNEWVVCAFSRLDIGVDIEKISSIKLEIAKRFFTKEEYDRILSKDAHERIVYFYELWTLKESYIKALGLGLTIPLNHVSFNICENGVEFKGENLMPKFGFS
jgi:4'-phosphopantetheinyl transferase